MPGTGMSRRRGLLLGGGGRRGIIGGVRIVAIRLPGLSRWRRVIITVGCDDDPLGRGGHARGNSIVLGRIRTGFLAGLFRDRSYGFRGSVAYLRRLPGRV